MKTFWLIIVILAAIAFGGGWLLWWGAQPDSMGMSALLVMLGTGAAVGLLALGFVVQVFVWIHGWIRG